MSTHDDDDDDEEGVFMFVSWQFSHHVQWAVLMARKVTATDGQTKPQRQRQRQHTNNK